MLLEESNQIFAGNSAVLGSRNSVSFETATIKPFTHGAGGNLTDLCDLTRCEDLHRRLSKMISLVWVSFRWTDPGGKLAPLFTRVGGTPSSGGSSLWVLVAFAPRTLGLGVHSYRGVVSGPSDPCLSSHFVRSLSANPEKPQQPAKFDILRALCVIPNWFTASDRTSLVGKYRRADLRRRTECLCGAQR